MAEPPSLYLTTSSSKAAPVNACAGAHFKQRATNSHSLGKANRPPRATEASGRQYSLARTRLSEYSMSPDTQPSEAYWEYVVARIVQSRSLSIDTNRSPQLYFYIPEFARFRC